MLKVQVLTFQGMESTSNDTKKKYECICGGSYNKSAGLPRHKKTCQAMNTEPQEGYTCSTCNKVFNQKDNRYVHLKNCTNKPKGVPPCSYPVCGKQFSSNYKLRQHVSQVHADEENRPPKQNTVNVSTLIGRKLKHSSSNTLKDVKHKAEHNEFEFVEEVSQFFAGIVECELVDKTKFFHIGDVSWFCLANVTQAIGINNYTNFQVHSVTSPSHTLDIVFVPTDTSTNSEHSNTISFKTLSTQHTDDVLHDAEPSSSIPTPTTPTIPTPTVTPKTLTPTATPSDLELLGNVVSKGKCFTPSADNETDTDASLNMSSTIMPNTQQQKCRIIQNIIAKVKAEGIDVMCIDDHAVMSVVLGKLGLQRSFQKPKKPSKAGRQFHVTHVTTFMNL